MDEMEIARTVHAATVQAQLGRTWEESSSLQRALLLGMASYLRPKLADMPNPTPMRVTRAAFNAYATYCMRIAAVDKPRTWQEEIEEERARYITAGKALARALKVKRAA